MSGSKAYWLMFVAVQFFFFFALSSSSSSSSAASSSSGSGSSSTPSSSGTGSSGSSSKPSSSSSMVPPSSSSSSNVTVKPMLSSTFTAYFTFEKLCPWPSSSSSSSTTPSSSATGSSSSSTRPSSSTNISSSASSSMTPSSSSGSSGSSSSRRRLLGLGYVVGGNAGMGWVCENGKVQYEFAAPQRHAESEDVRIYATPNDTVGIPETKHKVLRYDLNLRFEVDNASGCNITHPSGTSQPSFWAFMADAKITGKDTWKNTTGPSYECDVWTGMDMIAKDTKAVCVNSNVPALLNTPLKYWEYKPDGDVLIRTYIYWQPSVTDPSAFIVPETCQKPPMISETFSADYHFNQTCQPGNYLCAVGNRTEYHDVENQRWTEIISETTYIQNDTLGETAVYHNVFRYDKKMKYEVTNNTGCDATDFINDEKLLPFWAFLQNSTMNGSSSWQPPNGGAPVHCDIFSGADPYSGNLRSVCVNMALPDYLDKPLLFWQTGVKGEVEMRVYDWFYPNITLAEAFEVPLACVEPNDWVNSKTALYVALGVGISVIVLVIILICYRKRLKAQDQNIQSSYNQM